MSRRVVFVTQQVDPEHPVLAATVAMIRALAEIVDEVVVIALGAIPGALPSNCKVRVMGSRTRVGRGLRFAWHLARSLRPRPIAVVAHMAPVYAVLAAPLCRPARVPVVLWFTHWKATRLLRLAVRVADRVVTVAPASFPLRTSKVTAIGHGIDVDEFPCRARTDGRPPLRALALGRTSPSKGLESIARAVALARERGVDVQLEIRGPAETDEERAHAALVSLLAGDAVLVEPPVARHRLPELFARTDVLVNNTFDGSLDKVVLEAAASCVPVLAASSGFAELLPGRLRFPHDDADALSQRLEWLGRLSPEERHELGRDLRRRVVAGHSTTTWARRLLAAVEAP